MLDVLTPNGSQWRERWIPWPTHIKENGMAFYVRLLWEFLDVVERRMETDPNKKGVHAVPGVLDVLEHPHHSEWVDACRILLQYRRPPIQTPPDSGYSDLVQSQRVGGHEAFDTACFKTMKEGCQLSKMEFAQLSVEENYAHASHLFSNQVATDGYSTSVLLFRPKRDLQLKSDDPVVPAG
ncbi:hypothetical protein P3T76_013257 [Phytophthora citrophthora]|uniref:Uncharacterized protein n=1 Tax=Phytophthora citrophthora TaxID=4793 RepID=A0AAD9G372_9STRA|nr:hypothetical protein P3T76_013257 [Phytophthora citrophthora]